jgi:ABC-type multidrug transport system fused ATPase/permease subunit
MFSYRNRLSNDVQTIDQSAAEILMLFTQSCLATLAVIVVIIYATPAFIFIAVGICAMYTVIGTLYNTTSLAVKRVDSISKSPILNSFGEVSHGQTSIRAYADSARFTRDLLEKLEINVRAFHLLWQTNRVLSIYCDIIGSLVLVFAAVFILANDKLDAGRFVGVSREMQKLTWLFDRRGWLVSVIRIDIYRLCIVDCPALGGV